MKHKYLITAIALLATMLSSCVVCIETERRYQRNPKKYTNLTPLTVAELKSKLQTDNYKLVYIYEECEIVFGQYISKTLIPYVRQNKQLGIDLFAVNKHSGYLKDIEPTFEKNGIDLTPYYIRDNSPEFINYGKNRVADRNERIAKALFSNAGKADKIPNNVCYVVNKDNKIKLARYTCQTKQGPKSVVIPCPIERIKEPLDKIDFDAIVEIEQPIDETDYIYIIYFSKYNH